jgi:hypothetical protein
MLELFFKIWYLIFILPIYIIKEGYEKYKNYMKKNYPKDTLYPLYPILAVLIIVLVVLLLNGYPW